MAAEEIDLKEMHRAAKMLSEGAVIAYPTEGVWGLGCDPADESAVKKILELKQRPVEKGLILVADSTEKFSAYLGRLPSESDIKTDTSRPVTWVIEHHGQTPAWISGGRNAVAIRVTRHPVISALCTAANIPLVSTSANPAGQEPALNAEQVAQYFDGQIDMIVPGELGGEIGASEIREFSTGKILRETG